MPNYNKNNVKAIDISEDRQLVIKSNNRYFKLNKRAYAYEPISNFIFENPALMTGNGEETSFRIIIAKSEESHHNSFTHEHLT